MKNPKTLSQAIFSEKKRKKQELFKVFSKCLKVGEFCGCFWVFHKHGWECKGLMELNILILISTEDPKY